MASASCNGGENIPDIPGAFFNVHVAGKRPIGVASAEKNLPKTKPTGDGSDKWSKEVKWDLSYVFPNFPTYNSDAVIVAVLDIMSVKH